MAAAAWTTRKAMSTSKGAFSARSFVPASGGVTRNHDKQRKTITVPKGYLPVVLVRDDGGQEGGAGTGTGTGTGTETRVLVRVSDLKEPCMAALLEAAQQQFGYRQQAVLKVPCDAQRFDQVVSMARKVQ